MAKKRKYKRSLVLQVAIFFFIGIVLTGVLSRITLTRIADKNVVREKENLSSGIASDVAESIKEYKAYEWVIEYLESHLKENDLDLEYEATEKTNKKLEKLVLEHPGMILMNVTEKEVEEFSEEEQKIFAEIVFNRWLIRLNNLKKSYRVSYLYFLAADDTYADSYFFVSASDGKMKRGTEQGNAYVFGTHVKNIEEQSEAFKKLRDGNDYLVYTENYLDRYRYLFRIGNMNYISGMTFEIADIKDSSRRQTVQGMFYFVILQILLSVFCLLLIFAFAIRPLKRVNQSVGDYTETKNSEQVRRQLKKVKSKNEIGQLSEDIALMVHEIDEYLERIKNITAEQERISAELNVAMQIQANMLPSIFPPFPEIDEFDIYATMDPAKEVGGDFYDFFMVDDTHVGLVMADVSGKGVPAALFMVIAKTLIKNRAMLKETPSEILENVNNQLCEGNESGFFVTVWMAIIDIETGRGVVANAGHEHPVICKKGEKFELVVYRHSLAVAAMEGMKFKQHFFEMKPGDRIFVYTDGVPEATNTRNELYGTDRMLESLNKRSEESLEKILEGLRKDIDEFAEGATQFDDITMLIFDYKGKDGVEDEDKE